MTPRAPRVTSSIALTGAIPAKVTVAKVDFDTATDVKQPTPAPCPLHLPKAGAPSRWCSRWPSQTGT